MVIIDFKNKIIIKMAVGTVKWFDPVKGYGFIKPEKSGKDVFVHTSALEKSGLQSLNEGVKVSYELSEERGKTFATKIKII